MSKEKKYLTSLKILIDSQPEVVNEGFSRLTGPRFVQQRVKQCELDIDSRVIKFLFLAKDQVGNESSEEKALAAAAAKQGGKIKQALGGFKNFFDGFFGATLEDEIQYRKIQTLINNFFMYDKPAIFCDALNLLAKTILPIIKLSTKKEEERKKEDQLDSKKIKTEFSIEEDLSEYALGTMITTVMREDTNKIVVALDRTGAKKYGKQESLLFLPSFTKKFLLEDTYDNNLLQQDILEVEDVISSLKTVQTKYGITTVYEEFGQIIGYDTNREFDERVMFYDDFDSQAENDKKQGAQAMSIAFNQYVDFLLEAIEIFYSPVFKSKLPQEVTESLREFKADLNQHKANF